MREKVRMMGLIVHSRWVSLFKAGNKVKAIQQVLRPVSGCEPGGEGESGQTCSCSKVSDGEGEGAGSPAAAAADSSRMVDMIEYQEALSHTRGNATWMRADVAYVTTLQAAVFTIIGSGFPLRNIAHWLLAALAVGVALLGVNNVSRMHRYVDGYMRRAREIDRIRGLSLVSQGREEAKSRRVDLPVATTFKIYYGLIVLVWLAIAIISLIL